jgi:preprotein translocase subunit SecA
MYHRDVEYIVQEGQVVLIDEHTGRTMPGRRLSEGLHQAIEAKEGVSIQSESQTLASTTFQNYFRLYDKLAGMTGTADTEAFEFRQIYGLEVLVIPTNVPTASIGPERPGLPQRGREIRRDHADVKECMAKGAPVLVGTASIETSEALSARFRKAKIEHKVLNAKYHEQEAEIIAQAGRPGVVTIATNMAGRGTDIVLGGNLRPSCTRWAMSTRQKDEVRKPGSSATRRGACRRWPAHPRHRAPRIAPHRQPVARRAGRQGDPGVSRFYLSMEDNLMRIFASSG